MIAVQYADALRRRWVERMTAMILGSCLVVFAVFQLPVSDQPGPTSDVNRKAEVEVSVGKTEFSISLTDYGPSVVLIALALGLIAVSFLRPLKLGDEGQYVQYAEPVETTQSLPPLARDELEELRLGAAEVLSSAPDSDAAIRLRRLYETVFKRGRRTLEQQRRFEQLQERLAQGRLRDDEQAELNALRVRYLDQDKPPWD